MEVNVLLIMESLTNGSKGPPINIPGKTLNKEVQQSQ